MRACFLYPHSPSNAVKIPFSPQNGGPRHLINPIPQNPRYPSRIDFSRPTKNLMLEERGNADRTHIKALEGTAGIHDEDDDGLCPVDCVREFKSEEEFSRILEKAKETHSLVVVDFYRTSCSSCKYIEQGFRKLCKGSGDPVVFLKHNVLDEYDEMTETAERLHIKAVPLFHFYRDGILLEAFPTRVKERIVDAINKYA